MWYGRIILKSSIIRITYGKSVSCGRSARVMYSAAHHNMFYEEEEIVMGMAMFLDSEIVLRKFFMVKRNMLICAATALLSIFHLKYSIHVLEFCLSVNVHYYNTLKIYMSRVNMVTCLGNVIVKLYFPCIVNASVLEQSAAPCSTKLTWSITNRLVIFWRHNEEKETEIVLGLIESSRRIESTRAWWLERIDAARVESGLNRIAEKVGEQEVADDIYL